MITLGLIAIISTVAQADPPANSDPVTYIITLTDGTVVHGTYSESGNQATYQVDAPWMDPPPPPVPTLRNKIADVQQELRHKRDERREAEARKAGYTRISTATGDRYIRSDEIIRAERAAKMAAKVEAQTLPNAVPNSPEAVEAPTPVDQTPSSPLRRYGLQGSIAAAGLVIAFVLLKVLVFQKSE